MTTPPAPVRHRRTVLHVVALVASALVTIAVVVADAAFTAIDDANVNRAEAHGFDPTQLTPHGDLLWLALKLALVASVTTTVLLGVALTARTRGRS